MDPISLPDYHLTILEGHLDTFGHVNNAAYLELFEEARWQIITDNDYGLAQVREREKGPIVLEVNLKFLKELRLREKVKIVSELIEHKGRFSRMRQCIVKDDGKVAAEAVFLFGFFDLKARRLIEPSPEWRKAIGLPSPE